MSASALAETSMYSVAPLRLGSQRGDVAIRRRMFPGGDHVYFAMREGGEFAVVRRQAQTL
jgi:hypothetical protein